MASVVLGRKCLIECDLIIVANCTAGFRFEWKKDQGDGTEVPADLDGATAICQLRVENDGEIVLDASACVSFPGNGVVAIDLPPEITADVPAGKYPWDIIVTDAYGSAVRLAAGRATVVDPISEDDGE